MFPFEQGRVHDAVLCLPPEPSQFSGLAPRQRAALSRGFAIASRMHSLRSRLEAPAQDEDLGDWATEFVFFSGELISLGAEVGAFQWSPIGWTL